MTASLAGPRALALMQAAPAGPQGPPSVGALPARGGLRPGRPVWCCWWKVALRWHPPVLPLEGPAAQVVLAAGAGARASGHHQTPGQPAWTSSRASRRSLAGAPAGPPAPARQRGPALPWLWAWYPGCRLARGGMVAGSCPPVAGQPRRRAAPMGPPPRPHLLLHTVHCHCPLPGQHPRRRWGSPLEGLGDRRPEPQGRECAPGRAPHRSRGRWGW